MKHSSFIDVLDHSVSHSEREVLAALGQTDLPPILEPIEYMLT